MTDTTTEETATVLQVFIVRHGETEENRQGIMQGHFDSVLNEAGVGQAQLTASALEKVPFTMAHSSDLQRAVKTAEIILSKQKGVKLEQHEELRERFMGDLQGRKVAECSFTSANIEQKVEFSVRAIRWWNRIVLQSHLSKSKVDGSLGGHCPAKILVVTHGGFVKILLETLLGSRKIRCAKEVEIKKRCMNGSITVIEVGKSGKGVVESYADTAHLDVDLVEVNADVLEDDGDNDEGRREALTRAAAVNTVTSL